MNTSKKESGGARQPDKTVRQVQMNLPAAATAVSLEAFCENIIFRNEENGYTVALFSIKQPSAGDTATTKPVHSAAAPIIREFTAVGSMPFLEAGDYAGLSGKWVVHN